MNRRREGTADTFPATVEHQNEVVEDLSRHELVAITLYSFRVRDQRTGK